VPPSALEDPALKSNCCGAVLAFSVWIGVPIIRVFFYTPYDKHPLCGMVVRLAGVIVVVYSLAICVALLVGRTIPSIAGIPGEDILTLSFVCFSSSLLPLCIGGIVAFWNPRSGQRFFSLG